MSELKQALERIAGLEREARRKAKDGRDGRDGEPGPPGIGEPGPRGEKGIQGDRGPQGDRGIQGLRGEKGDAGDRGPDGARGEPGAKGTPGVDGKDGDPGPRGPRGPKGERGEQGPKGDRGAQGDVGPIPEHEWDGAKLRFEQPGHRWGEWVDLRGPRGYSGAGGGALTFDALPVGDTSTPTEIIVKQHGSWARITWAAFLDLVGTAPPSYTPSLDFSDTRNSGYLSLRSIGI